MKTTSVEEFYDDIATPLPAEISKEIGHFNVFRCEEAIANLKIRPEMSSNCDAKHCVGSNFCRQRKIQTSNRK